MAHTLLLAEPSLTIQRVVQLTFANEDIDVVVATDGAEAMKLAERLHPDVVLADVSLGLYSGYEVATFIRNHPQLTHVRVVLLSGAFERVDHNRASEISCDLVLAKPFDPLQLLTQVKSLIGAPRSERQGEFRAPGATPAAVAPPPVQAPAPIAPAPFVQGRIPVDSGLKAASPWAGFLAPGFTRDGASAHAEGAPPAKAHPVAPPEDPYVFRRFAPEPGKDGEGAGPGQSGIPVETVGVPAPERLPSFEMLGLINKAMHLVQPPAGFEEEEEASPAPVNDMAAPAGHDLGNLIPALDDYFDQLDAAFATNVDPGFRRAPDLPPPVTVAPTAPLMPRPQPREMAPPSPAPLPPVPVKADRIEDRGPLVSPFSTLRPDASQSAIASAGGGSASIDDAYDALMRQINDPKPRSSVVALRADDELLVERAVERVLTRIDPTAVREAMEEVITNLAKRVIKEEIERIRRP